MSSGDDTGERNPFAPPPADAPDRPWRPRAHPHPPAEGQGGGDRDNRGDRDDPDERPQVPPPHPWSPGYRGGWSEPPQPRFDPTDPVHRRARYALSAGMAGLFCSVVGMQYLALLLGALAAYWGVSALRSGRATAAAGTAGAAGAASGGNPHALGTARIGGWAQPQPTRPQVPAALGGLLTGGVAVIFTLSIFGFQLYYHDYVTCINDALTTEASQSCNDLAPDVITQITNPGNR
ncbi:hypothetical protein [Kitasatospora sp. KL5]|uniref:hypothetical protein n=1 Tax=Kitasatospora sp. KL5 TaxID=3425125 RepID=UPI003D6F0255